MKLYNYFFLGSSPFNGTATAALSGQVKFQQTGTVLSTIMFVINFQVLNVWVILKHCPIWTVVSKVNTVVGLSRKILVSCLVAEVALRSVK